MIVLIIFLLPIVYGCPSSQKLLPCTCSGDWRTEQIVCPGILNEQTLIDVMHAFQVTKNFYSFTIEGSTFRFLPQDIFKGITFQEFKLKSSTFMSLTDTDIAFEGLEDDLAALVIIDSTVVSTWDWSVLRNLKKLTKLTIEAGLIMISDEISMLQPTNLKDFNFANNEISYVHDTAFSAFKDVMSITLMNNSIEEVKRSMMPNPAPNLWLLNFSYNKIQQLPADLFENMPKLTTINLNANQLLILNEKPFTDAWGGLKYLAAIDNPLRCDCRMIWLTRLSKPKYVNAVCDQPLHLKGINVVELTEKDLWC